MSYATTDNVSTALGRPASSIEEAAQWQYWLGDVLLRISARFRRAGLDLAVQVANGTPTEAEVASVQVAAVVRKVQNPTWGRTSMTRSIDDWSRTERNEGGDSSRDPLDLLEAEWLLILPNAGPGRARAFSVMPS